MKIFFILLCSTLYSTNVRQKCCKNFVQVSSGFKRVNSVFPMNSQMVNFNQIRYCSTTHNKSDFDLRFLMMPFFFLMGGFMYLDLKNNR